jgi:hypothetical protein
VHFGRDITLIRMPGIELSCLGTPTIVTTPSTLSRKLKPQTHQNWPLNSVIFLFILFRLPKYSRTTGRKTQLGRYRDRWRDYKIMQGDQNVSVHLMITVQTTQKYFKQFQSITMITQLELGITDGVSVRLVSPWPWRSAAKPISEARKTCIVIIRCTETFRSPCKMDLYALFWVIHT